MHLLIVTQSVDQNDENLGAFYYWFDALARKAKHVTILALRDGTRNLPAHVEAHNFGEGKTALSKLWTYWELFSHFFARADAVFFHQSPEFVLAAAPFLLGTREKKTSVFWYAHKSVTWRLKLAERLVDWIVSSSPDGFRMPSKKVVFVGQAINTDLFKLSPTSNREPPTSILRLISIGRISPIKDYETIIRACSLLSKRTEKKWTLSVIGGPLLPRDVRYLNQLQSLAGLLDIKDNVQFYGARPYSDIPKLLQEHDIFLNVSRTGSVDKAVMEAMACGLTIITANEAYRPIVPQKYFLEHVSPEFLSQRILALLDDPRPNLALREIVLQNHSLEKTIDHIFSLLSQKI